MRTKLRKRTFYYHAYSSGRTLTLLLFRICFLLFILNILYIAYRVTHLHMSTSATVSRSHIRAHTNTNTQTRITKHDPDEKKNYLLSNQSERPLNDIILACAGFPPILGVCISIINIPIPSLHIPPWLTYRLYNCSCYVNAK